MLWAKSRDARRFEGPDCTIPSCWNAGSNEGAVAESEGIEFSEPLPTAPDEIWHLAFSAKDDRR